MPNFNFQKFIYKKSGPRQGVRKEFDSARIFGSPQPDINYTNGDGGRFDSGRGAVEKHFRKKTQSGWRVLTMLSIGKPPGKIRAHPESCGRAALLYLTKLQKPPPD
jgi:hypothetical protein